MTVELPPARDDELDRAGEVVAEAYRTNPGMDDVLEHLEDVRDAHVQA